MTSITTILRINHRYESFEFNQPTSKEIIMATKTKVLGYTYFIYLCQYGEVWVRFGQEVPQGLQYTGRKVLNPTDLGPVYENFVLTAQG